MFAWQVTVRTLWLVLSHLFVLHKSPSSQDFLLRGVQTVLMILIFLLIDCPLMTIYHIPLPCRSLGFSIEDTALVNTAVPLADILGPPAAGILADKLGNFGVFMGVVTALNGAASLALLLIPRVSSQVRAS